MPLVIYGLEGMHTHIYLCIGRDFKKPGVRRPGWRMPDLKSQISCSFSQGKEIMGGQTTFEEKKYDHLYHKI